jgi:hypothetical protein
VPTSLSQLTVSCIAFSPSLFLQCRLLLPICVFLSQSPFLLEIILHPSTTLILSLHHNYTAAMARNRKPPSGRTTVTSDGSPGWEEAGDEEAGNEVDTVHITDQFSASFPLA